MSAFVLDSVLYEKMNREEVIPLVTCKMELTLFGLKRVRTYRLFTWRNDWMLNSYLEQIHSIFLPKFYATNLSCWASPWHVAHAHQKWLLINCVQGRRIAYFFVLPIFLFSSVITFLAKCQTSFWWSISGCSVVRKYSICLKTNIYNN